MFFVTAMADPRKGAPMSPSDQWLFDTLTSMRQEGQEQHQRLRSDVNAGFDKLWEEMKSIRSDLSGTDKRLLVVETERGAEAKQAASKAGWVAFLAGAVLTLLMKVFDWLGKR